VDLVHEAGIAGMRRLISDTARWGELTVGPKIIDRTVQKHMRAALRKIRSGKFAREFIEEMKTGRRRYAKLLREVEKHPIEKVGARLRRLMSWTTETKTR
jgi:ketol-acid reductoisomerase